MSKPRRSMRAAINAFCRSCIYDPSGADGTWREQVENCPSRECPLYDFRPCTSRKVGDSTPSRASLEEG